MKLFVFVMTFICGLFLSAQEGENSTYPVFRGCNQELSFEETKKCTSDKIIDYIKVSFNYELADKVFPTDLTTKFYVEFTINEKGKTKDINVKAHHKAIAVDVIQLIKRMPKFKAPGTIDGKPIDTRFNALMTVRLLG
ncbi:energy transducer TonB [Winogradskyella sp. PC D3.3]